jgi:hypothetical protein
MTMTTKIKLSTLALAAAAVASTMLAAGDNASAAGFRTASPAPMRGRNSAPIIKPAFTSGEWHHILSGVTLDYYLQQSAKNGFTGK